VSEGNFKIKRKGEAEGQGGKRGKCAKGPQSFGGEVSRIRPIVKTKREVNKKERFAGRPHVIRPEERRKRGEAYQVEKEVI